MMDTHHDGKRAWFTSDPAFQAGYAKGLEDAALKAESLHGWHGRVIAEAIRMLAKPPANDNPEEIDTDNIGGLH